MVVTVMIMMTPTLATNEDVSTTRRADLKVEECLQNVLVPPLLYGKYTVYIGVHVLYCGTVCLSLSSRADLEVEQCLRHVLVPPLLRRRAAAAAVRAADRPRLGRYPIVTSQHSSTALYQVSYHNQQLFF
jgi:hypothetical protein